MIKYFDCRGDKPWQKNMHFGHTDIIFFREIN